MSSPTQRSLKELRKTWSLVEVTERWCPFSKRRKDLYQFVDVLCCDKDATLAVQTTSGANVSARFEKIRTLPSVVYWLACPTRRLVIHGWSKRGERGKVKRWTCREVEIVLGETGSPVMKEA